MHINSFECFIYMFTCDNSIVLALSGLIIVFALFPLFPFLGYLLNNNNGDNNLNKKSYEFLILFNNKYKEYFRKFRKFLIKITYNLKFK